MIDVRQVDNNLATMNCTKLYRYLPDEAAIKTIETRRFRVSRLTDLNDPFEWRFGVEGCPPEFREIFEKAIEGFVELASQYQGIISFSKEVTDPILWSHYANHHRGIAFEVDSSRVPNLHKVDYDKPRIVLPFQRFMQMPELDQLELIKNFFKQKSGSWRYEQEYRWVIHLEKCVPSGGRFDWNIPDGFITRVIIGFRSSVSEQYVRRALDLNDLQNIQVAKARMSQNTYKIELPEMSGLSPSA